MSFTKDVLKDYFETAVRFWEEEDTSGSSLDFLLYRVLRMLMRIYLLLNV
ncbi:hypothetical protein [Oceanobacillus oncorhynchi]|nr:hypothetical protein [Oceanobacillus oncorhynchi]